MRFRWPRLHLHDYEMQFIGLSLNYRLVCRCGDIAPDQVTALRRMKFPVLTWK